MHPSRPGALAQPSPTALAEGAERIELASRRIGVRDGWLATLAIRNYSAEAITGLGLGVVEALSRAWGAAADGDGNLVWAEFDLAGAKTVDAPSAPFHTDSPDPSKEPGGAEMRTVRFPGVPVDTYLALQEHNDALFRELELLAIEHDDSARSQRPPRLRAVAREPPDPRVPALRRWFVEQMAGQLLDGRPPTPPSR
jgi:hypothetical protein